MTEANRKKLEIYLNHMPDLEKAILHINLAIASINQIPLNNYLVKNALGLSKFKLSELKQTIEDFNNEDKNISKEI